MSKRSTRQRDRDRETIRRTGAGCHICGEPIDYTLRYIAGSHGAKCRRQNCTGCTPDPMRFEADHVIPLEKGGLDVLANKRASHRKCNSRKRARLVAPIVRRSTSLA